MELHRLRPTLTRHLGAGIVAIAGLAGCGGDIVPPEPVPHVRISGGNGQTGVALDTLALPLEITVVDDAGDPVFGRTVTWSAGAGGGRLLPVAPTTDAAGKARALWILGLDSGGHNASAAVAGEDEAVEFTATASAVEGLKAIALMHGSTSTAQQPHMCALAADSLAWCWGGNAAGTLGNGTTTASSVPVQVLGGHTFASIYGEGFNTCGLRAAGELWCWGRNAARSPVFGNGPTDEPSSSPVRAAGGFLFRDFDLEASFACGITTESRAYCWGDGDGASGTAGTGDFSRPSEIVGDRSWLEIAVSDDGRCAVAEDHGVYCWFDPDFDRWQFIGVPEEAGPDDTPLPVGIVGTLAGISLGEFGACGISLDGAGTAVCWGFGAAPDPPGPASHRLGSSVRKIVSDGFARAALDAQGQLWVWNSGGCCNLEAGRGSPLLLFPGVEWSDLSLATGLHVISARDSIAFSLGPIPEVVSEASFELVPVPLP